CPQHTSSSACVHRRKRRCVRCYPATYAVAQVIRASWPLFSTLRGRAMLDLGRTFLASVERSPDSLALVDNDVRLTYAQWMEHIAAAAGGLEQIGLRRGDHLLSLMQNRWQAATLHWACQFLGVILTPLNWRAKADEVEYCVLDADAKALAYDAAGAAAANATKTARTLPRIVLSGEIVGVVSFHELIRASPPRNLVNATAEDWSVMLYTSGTT